MFINDDLLNNVVLETNHYAKDYITVEKETGRLPPKSKFRSWPEEGITIEKLKKFIALTFYYFGVVKKDNIKSYWLTNSSILSMPFPNKVMSCDKFLNIFSFIHCEKRTRRIWPKKKVRVLLRTYHISTTKNTVATSILVC